MTEPQISRIIIEAYYRKCVDEIIPILALMNFSNNIYTHGHSQY